MTTTSQQDISIVILAAGSSTRMGQSKQLLRYENKLLLQQVVEQVISVKDIHPLVVLGAHKEAMRSLLHSFNTDIIENDDWAAGMATSIRVGIIAARKQNPHLSACMFVVCDQPFLDANILQQLIQSYRTEGKGIVAAGYANTFGTPVLFSRRYFDQLLLLQNEEGAKKIVNQHPDDLAIVPFPLGHIDIDTPEDYARLIDNTSGNKRGNIS